MTRAFLGSNSIGASLDALRAQFPAEVLADPEIAEIFSVKKDEVLRVAARLIRYFTPDMQALDRIMKYNLSAPANNGMSIFRVPVIPGEKGTTNVVVFPNLMLPAHALSNLQTLAGLSADYGGDDILNLIRDDRRAANPAKYESIHRVVRLFGRREVMPFTRALSRYTRDEVAKQMTPERIRTIGEYYAEAIKGFTITWCEKPEDYVAMYERGLSSCMVSSSGAREWGFLLKEFNINPTSFFYYHPNTKGAYVHRDGKVIARCIVYEGMINGTRVKAYGRVYSSNKDVETKFVTALISAGYTRPLQGGLFSCTFKVPKRVSKTVGGTVFPYPYFDNLSGDIFVEDTKDEDYFTVYHNHPGQKGTRIALNSTAGYALFGKAKVYCAHCASDIHPGRAVVAQDGAHFCGHNHARAHGYVEAFRADGQQVLVANSHRLIPRWEGGYFTNLEAAILLRAKPVLAEFDYETPIYTLERYGNTQQVNYNGDGHVYIPTMSRRTPRQERIDHFQKWRLNNSTIVHNQVSALTIPKSTDPILLLKKHPAQPHRELLLSTEFVKKSRVASGAISVAHSDIVIME